MNYLERIKYEPDTGLFRWAVGGRGFRKNETAGSVTSCGYRQIGIGFKVYRAHRLAWFLTHGTWPIGEIDHINGDPLDNRLINLRDVDRSTNAQNQHRAQSDNKSCGLLGATWNKQHKRWQSKIMVKKVIHHVGYFETAQLAHEAYLLKKRVLHSGCTI